MSEQVIFLAGYGGRHPDWLLAAATSLDAVVFDVRLSPRSRRPEWSGHRLTALLGNRYQHVPGWGNVNYRGGPIVLADPESGLAAWDAEDRAVILLCQCRESATCHRRTVADYLIAQRGVTVQELDTALATIAGCQVPLFGTEEP